MCPNMSNFDGVNCSEHRSEEDLVIRLVSFDAQCKKQTKKQQQQP